MKKIERRAVVCVVLALILAAGLSVFLVKYCLDGVTTSSRKVLFSFVITPPPAVLLWRSPRPHCPPC